MLACESTVSGSAIVPQGNAELNTSMMEVGASSAETALPAEVGSQPVADADSVPSSGKRATRGGGVLPRVRLEAIMDPPTLLGLR